VKLTGCELARDKTDMPVAFQVLVEAALEVIGDAIYCDACHARTTGLLSNFLKCPPSQILYRK